MTLVVTFLIPASAQAASPFNSALTRAPYLTDLVGTHANVDWATDRSATTGSLQWGPVTGGTCSLANTLAATRSSVTVGAVGEYQWKVSLSLPGQGTYCYRPLLASTDLLSGNSSPQFQTQVAAGDTAAYSFDVFGDWGQVDSSGNSVDQSNLFAQVAASGARFAVTVGDNGYPNGSQQNYGDLQQKGADTSAIFGPTFWTAAGSTIPLFTAAGNHGLSGTTHTDITTWTQDSAVSTSGGRYQNDTYCCVNGTSSANYGSEWYAFDAGPARFYVLDSAWGDTNTGTANVYANDAAAHFAPGTPEYTWLLNDLQTHPSALKFAFSHYPFYSDNPNQSSDTSLQGATGLEGLLGSHGVNIVFNGHAHLYERNTPSASGMPITYVTGGGGGTLQPIGPCHSYDAYGIGWSPTKLTGTACGAAAGNAPTSAAQVFHFLKVTVAGTTVTVAPTDENGRTFDVQTYTFGTAANDFSVSAAPSSVAVTAGQSANATINTAVTSGSAQTVALSAGSLPSGIAATFSPSSVSAGAASTLTITTTSGVAAGTYPVAVTATGPSATHTASVSVTVGAGSGSAPQLVQAVGATESSSSTSLAATLPAASRAGDLLVLSASVYTGATNHLTSVTDSAGNLWNKVNAWSTASHNSDGELWYAANAKAATTVTAHVATATSVAFEVHEFSGIAATNPLDVSAGGSNTSTAANSGTLTPSAAGELLVGFAAGHANAQPMTPTPAVYTVQKQQTTTGSIASVVTGYQVLTPSSTVSFGAGFGTAMYWAAGLAAFKAAG